MSALPTCIDHFIIANEDHKRWLSHCVRGNNFPSHDTKGLVFYGSYGGGKTLLAEVLPILIEYERATENDQVEWNFSYKYEGKNVSITRDQEDKTDFDLKTNFYGCGSLRAKDIDEIITEISKEMSNQHYVDLLCNQQFQYYIFDEFDTVDIRSQQKFKSLMTNTFFNKSIFIFTTNHIEKFDKGVLSRCKAISFMPANADLYLPMLTKYHPNLTNYDADKTETLKKAFDGHQGDVRKMLRFCESLEIEEA